MLHLPRFPLPILKPDLHEQFLCNDFQVTNIVDRVSGPGNICNSSKLEEDINDHCSCIHNLCSCETKA